MDLIPVLNIPDIGRLVEDLAATLPLFGERHGAQRLILPTAAALTLLGQSYLNAGAKLESFPLAHDAGFIALTEAWLWPTDVGDLHLSYFLAGVILARQDVSYHFCDYDGEQVVINWPRCVQWLIVHGAKELNLFPFMHRTFLFAMQSETVFVQNVQLNPLQTFIALERPEWIAELGGLNKDSCQQAVHRWLQEAGNEPYLTMFAQPQDRRKKSHLDRVKSRINMLRDSS